MVIRAFPRAYSRQTQHLNEPELSNNRSTLEVRAMRANVNGMGNAEKKNRAVPVTLSGFRSILSAGF
jgi:hypothetical protein